MPRKLPVPFPSVPPFFHHPIPPHQAASSLPLLLSLHPSSRSVSFHLCHYCPLSNLITQALYPPPHPARLPPPLPVCLSLLYPRVSIPRLAAVARHQGQISPSLPASLPPSFFFLPPLTLHFLCSVAILKFLPLPVWPDLFLLFPPLVSSINYGAETVVIFLNNICSTP